MLGNVLKFERSKLETACFLGRLGKAKRINFEMNIFILFNNYHNN